jgi:hypothetical protein
VEDPWTWAKPYTNSWRATGDHHDTWAGKLSILSLTNEEAQRLGDGTAKVIEQIAGKGKYAGPGGWNDLDFVYTGGEGCWPSTGAHCPGQSDIEYDRLYT